MKEYQLVQEGYDIEKAMVDVVAMHGQQQHHQNQSSSRQATKLVMVGQPENTLGRKSYYSSMFFLLLSFIGCINADGIATWVFFAAICTSMTAMLLINYAFCMIHERIYDQQDNSSIRKSSPSRTCDIICKNVVECTCLSLIFIAHILMALSGFIFVAAVGVQLYEHHRN